MNIQKLIAIAVAILINCAVLLWFHAWTSSVVASAAIPRPTSTQVQKVRVLPAITVRPSAEQLRALRHTRATTLPGQANAGGGRACFVMPYYSFAEPPSECAES